jgi:hypothetical protein
MKITLLLILLTSINVLGQTKTCNLTLNESPEIRGLKLGKTKEKIQKLFPSKELKIVERFSESSLSEIDGFKDVSSLSMLFLSDWPDITVDKLHAFSLQYKKEIVEWDSVYEFAQNLSQNLNLPLNAWEYILDRAEMHCEDFEIKIDKSNNISVRSTVLEKKVKERKEEKKKAF